MTTDPQTPMGRQLYGLLPETYRSRDNGDLAALLDGLGHMLGRVRATLEQRLADSFPDEPLQGAPCQPWLLPYFAELVDARLVSPDPSGQRAEVANAIAWRQVKGTPASVEQVAQEVGRFEVEVQEGWKRVAVTPRAGWPLPSAPQGRPGSDPYAVDRPVGTVAFGAHARALATANDDPEGRTTRFGGAGGKTVRWRQANPHGSPCFPGSYEDPSARTVDLRSPDWRRGHTHPRRLLLYYPPPAGFFLPGAVPVAWAAWENGVQELDTKIAALLAAGVDLLPISGGRVIERIQEGAQPVLYRIRKAEDVSAERTTEADGTVVTRLLLAGQWLEERAHTGRRELRSLGDVVRVQGDVHLIGDETWVFEKLAFLGDIDVHTGRLVLRNGAAKEITAGNTDKSEPVVQATGSLLLNLATEGLARLEYVTVMGALEPGRLQASDSILAGTVSTPLDEAVHCIRYSRVDAGVPGTISPFCTAARPLFVELDFDDGQGTVRRPAQYGETGCAVLHPACVRSIRFGAEDGGEMGAFHDRRYSLALEAVDTKLKDYLPLGLEAALIPDPRLYATPPAFTPAQP